MSETAKKTAVVTGATSGLGEAAAVALAKEGYRMLLVGRDAVRGAAVVERIRAAGGTAEFLAADLFSIADVRRLGGEIVSRAPTLDLLVNNAGGMFSKKELTGDGIERTFAINVVAPFILSDELFESLAAAGGRIVNVVTGVPKNAKATLEQLAGAGAGGGLQSYTRSKLALGALTREQQKRFKERGVSVVSLHPGIIPNTRFGQELPAAMRKIGNFVAKLFGLSSTIEQAAARFVKVGTGPIEGGGFYKEGTLAPAPVLATDAKFGAALWARLEALSGG